MKKENNRMEYKKKRENNDMRECRVGSMNDMI